MWDSHLVEYWRSYVPPCRPSRFELDLCKSELHKIREAIGDRAPRLLVLGSTNEYRDLGFEERCEIVVTDNSKAFHEAISEDRRYKNSREIVHVVAWEDMNFGCEFDMVVGDLVVGNVAPERVADFVANVHKSLRPSGTFITKSFFFDQSRQGPLLDAFHRFENGYRHEDPFPYLAYQLTLAAMDPKTHMLEFGEMFKLVRQAHVDGIVSTKTYERYLELGWHDGGKIQFHVMPIQHWEDLLNRFFSSYTISYAPYAWAHDYPIYCAYK